MNPGLTLTYTAVGAITNRRIVKHSTATTTGDTYVAQAAASTDGLIGVSAPNIDVADGGRIDVQHSGVAEVEAGGTITRDDFVTADANGKAVTCAPAAGAKAQSIGKALMSAVAGDRFDVLLTLSQVTTPV